MEVEDVLKVNQKITLVVPDGHNAGSYPSRVEDIGLDAVVVAAPTHKGALLKLAEGQAVCIQVVRRDGLYKPDTIVESVIAYPFPMIQLAKPVAIARDQRRRYARADVSIPARYRCLDRKGDERLAAHRGMVTNVSGGGALIVTWQSRSDLRVGSCVDVELEFPWGRIAAQGTVVRMGTAQADAGMVQEVAVEFKDIDERQRDALAKYVLQRQLELRRKGLL